MEAQKDAYKTKKDTLKEANKDFLKKAKDNTSQETQKDAVKEAKDVPKDAENMFYPTKKDRSERDIHQHYEHHSSTPLSIRGPQGRKGSMAPRNTKHPRPLGIAAVDTISITVQRRRHK